MHASIEAWARGRRAAELEAGGLRDMVERLVGVCENLQTRIEALEAAVTAPSTPARDEPGDGR